MNAQAFPCFYVFAWQNERLKAEQMYYMKTLLKQAKDFEKKLSEEEEVDKTEVISVMKNKWQAQKEEDKSVAGK